MHSTSRDHEMVMQWRMWVLDTMVRERQNKIQNYDDRKKFRKEFDNYFHWVCGLFFLTYFTNFIVY